MPASSEQEGEEEEEEAILYLGRGEIASTWAGKIKGEKGSFMNPTVINLIKLMLARKLRDVRGWD